MTATERVDYGEKNGSHRAMTSIRHITFSTSAGGLCAVLGPFEADLLDELWLLGTPVTNKRMWRAMQQRRELAGLEFPALTTVQTTLERLVDKGFVVVDRTGGVKRYTTVLSRQAFIDHVERLLRAALDDFLVALAVSR